VTDPVTKQRFQPTAQSPKATFADRSYYFAADSSRTRFLGTPQKYADRGVDPQ
jgi:YHS domain-containing protein